MLCLECTLLYFSNVFYLILPVMIVGRRINDPSNVDYCPSLFLATVTSADGTNNEKSCYSLDSIITFTLNSQMEKSLSLRLKRISAYKLVYGTCYYSIYLGTM